MLTQAEAATLLEMPKVLLEQSPIEFPVMTEEIQLDAVGESGREKFIFDVNRKGKLKISKCTYQNRFEIVETLLRLDIDGPMHVNPDGEEVPCPHLHIYDERYGTKRAIPAPACFSNTTDLHATLRDFLKYCKVDSIPDIQRRVE